MAELRRNSLATPRASFEARLLARLRRQFAAALAQVDDASLRALIREGVARAAHYRLLSERDACRFIELLLSFGKEVDHAGGRVAEALRDPALASGAKRLDRAFERAWRARLGLARKQVLGEFSDAPATLDELPSAQVQGAALAFAWDGALKLCRARATVAAPQWQAGTEFADGAGSLRPAALRLPAAGDTLRAELRLRLDVCDASGELEVSGRLGGFRLEGSCPASRGEHRVGLSLSPAPRTLQCLQGDVAWQVSGGGLAQPVTLANPARLECYVLLGRPAAFFEPAGVWVEALRFLFARVGVGGLATAAEAAEAVARFCHGSHGLRYDTFHGAPAYGCSGSGGAFQLGAYLTAAKPVVNCYDQAGAVQSLCGALGVAAHWFYLRPYGFIHATPVVGVGACNNPFFSNNGSNPTVGVNDRQRTAFANHAFAGLDDVVLDACAGPHTGTESPSRYVAAAIDERTTLYRFYTDFRAGTAADIIRPDGVTKVV